MASEFSNVADDFYVNMNLQTTLAMPSGRETILHFCEAVQKEFGSMSGFYLREGGEYVLEGDRESGSYRWLEIHANRLCAGYFNPTDIASAKAMHDWLLERSVYYLGLGGLDVDCLDATFGFNLDYAGNRDAIVAQALLDGSPLGILTTEGPAQTIECEPNFVVALDEQCYLQARLAVETRGSSYQLRSGRYDPEPISVHFTIRQYPEPGKLLNIRESFARQMTLCESLVERVTIPQVLNPLVAAIAAGQ